MGGDKAFGGLAVSATSGLHNAFLAEKFDGSVHVTFSLGEGFFTSHHTGVGDLAELLNSRCSNHGN